MGEMASARVTTDRVRASRTVPAKLRVSAVFSGYEEQTLATIEQLDSHARSSKYRVTMGVMVGDDGSAPPACDLRRNPLFNPAAQFETEVINVNPESDDESQRQ